LIRLLYHGKERLVEPHDHGVLNGSVQLLGYQVAGFSSRPLPNWILMKADEMADLKLSEKTFERSRKRQAHARALRIAAAHASPERCE
jgi:hypothetical protein